MDSNLLDMRGATNLINLCEFSRHQKWKCIYQASADGFSSASFHDKCDGVTATLTIIKTTNGNIFGGYTDKPWNSKVTPWSLYFISLFPSLHSISSRSLYAHIYIHKHCFCRLSVVCCPRA